MPELMPDDPAPLKTEMRRVRLGDLTLLPPDENANYMTEAQFENLVNNIRTDGCLTSVPLVRETDDGTLIVLSGNHRTRAATEALGADTEVDVMVTTSEISRSRELALQLSHNAVHGQDDKRILARLFAEIDEIDWRTFSGLADMFTDDQPIVTIPDLGSISDSTLDYQTLTIVFLPEALEAGNRVFDEVSLMLAGAQDTWGAAYADHSRLLDGLDQVGSSLNLKDRAAAMAAILDVFERHTDDLTTGFAHAGPDDTRDWVPISTVLGTDRLPADVAAGLARVAAVFVNDGDIEPTARWKTIAELVKLFDAFAEAATRVNPGASDV